MRLLFAFLLVAALAVLLALLFKLNAGYALFVAPPYRVEVSLNAYPNNLPPMTDAELKACTTSDWGYTSSWPDITGVTIPPNGKISVRVQSYYESTQTTYSSTGSFGLTVTTTAMN